MIVGPSKELPCCDFEVMKYSMGATYAQFGLRCRLIVGKLRRLIECSWRSKLSRLNLVHHLILGKNLASIFTYCLAINGLSIRMLKLPSAYRIHHLCYMCTVKCRTIFVGPGAMWQSDLCAYIYGHTKIKRMTYVGEDGRPLLEQTQHVVFDRLVPLTGA